MTARPARRGIECEHESDVLSAVYTNRWPEQVSDELRDHVFECQVCADVVAVAAAFEADTDRLRAHAHVPDATIVWWRAQLRSRIEAEKEAVRPITVAQAIGLAAAVGVVGAIFGATATWFQNTLGWLGRTLRAMVAWIPAWPSLPALPDGLAPTLAGYAWIVGLVVLFVLAASVAVYVAVRATESDA
jgi:hypothetical protein